jgi:hypothetical protein
MFLRLPRIAISPRSGATFTNILAYTQPATLQDNKVTVRQRESVTGQDDVKAYL